MTSERLTEPAEAANVAAMHGRKHLRRWSLPASPLIGMVAGSMILSACVSVKAPDKPIVIELNINIRQEVVYRLAEDAGATIEDNPDIF